VTVPFDEGQPLPPVASGPGFWEIWDTIQRPLLTVVALVMAFLLGLKVVRAMAASAPPRQQLASPEGARSAGETELPAGGLEEKGESLRKQLSPAQAQRMQAVTTGVVDRPDLAARVVQAWLKE
jgi:flagellar biosynthesis/type III secretory pathway M-ring protein FliF/YscJ